MMRLMDNWETMYGDLAGMYSASERSPYPQGPLVGRRWCLMAKDGVLFTEFFFIFGIFHKRLFHLLRK